MSNNRAKNILIELGDHLPFSIFGVIASMILMGILTYISTVAGAGDKTVEASRELFHLFHPAHVLFSAIATTAMFWRHDNRSVIKACFVGFFGSVVICGVSDIFIPYLGGMILGSEMHFHICIIDEPFLVFPFAIIGVLTGFAISRALDHSTQYSHGVHVFLSSFASLLYLVSFGFGGWMHHISAVFFVTVIAVVIPCCLSDIVFPLVCTHKYCKHKG